ncbi:hypothetical protein Pelo_19411 [Pelomyxa schiedti]|nr:hypothetical protein Pelo_19411 [Pelomyxa schiedti]
MPGSAPASPIITECDAVALQNSNNLPKNRYSGSCTTTASAVPASPLLAAVAINTNTPEAPHNHRVSRAVARPLHHPLPAPLPPDPPKALRPRPPSHHRDPPARRAPPHAAQRLVQPLAVLDGVALRFSLPDAHWADEPQQQRGQGQPHEDGAARTEERGRGRRVGFLG